KRTCRFAPHMSAFDPSGHGTDFDLRQKRDWEERVALRHRFGVLPLIASVWVCCRRSGSPIPKEARMSKDYSRLDKNNAAVLMVDHQAGLLSLVRDIEPDKFKNNVLALADLAAYFKLPTILTTSFEEGPNGPLMPELKEKFPKAPFIPRPGQ